MEDERAVFDKIRLQNKDSNLGDRYALARGYMTGGILELVRLAPYLYQFTGLWRERKGIHICLSLATVHRIMSSGETKEIQVDMMNEAMVDATFVQDYGTLRAFTPQDKEADEKEQRWSPSALRVLVTVLVTADEKPICIRAMFGAHLPIDLTNREVVRKLARLSNPDGLSPDDESLDVAHRMLMSYIQAGGDPRDFAHLQVRDPETDGADRVIAAIEYCGYCKKGHGLRLKKCGRCKTVRYCSLTCQTKDWGQHRQECKKNE